MLSRIINSIEEAIIALLLATMTLLVFVEVVLRFGFGTGMMWAQELTLHLSAWMVLFGASYGIKVGSHIGVDALVKILPPLARRIVGGAAVAACLFYCGLFAKGAWVYLAMMYKIGIELEDMPIPKWIAHSILLIGMILMAIRLLMLLWGVFTGKTEGFTLADEAKESLHLAEETKAAARGGDSA
ncbi:MAG TPA: TRAP transporter small permease [Geopsychrobacteraceae bacterium]|jgi:C4-dicarboxylate transporter DctQ subunit